MAEPQMREIEFIHWLVRLLEAHPDFDSLQLESLLSTSERHYRADIICARNGHPLIIEAKGAAPLVQRRIHDSVAQLQAYGQFVPKANLVLTTPVELQSKYKDLFNSHNIEVWDAPQLAHLFAEQLPTIDGSPLHSLLSRYKIAPARTESDELIDTLRGIAPGKSEWSTYQKHCATIFEYLFTPPLGKPLYESSDAFNVNRRDIILPNYAESGFWRFLQDKYTADYIVIDAKNYTKDIPKSSVLQMANYLKDFGAGLFGMVCSPCQPNKSAIHTQREQWLVHRKMIVCINNDDLVQMITIRADDGTPEDVIKQRIEDFRLAV